MNTLNVTNVIFHPPSDYSNGTQIAKSTPSTTATTQHQHAPGPPPNPNFAADAVNTVGAELLKRGRSVERASFSWQDYYQQLREQNSTSTVAHVPQSQRQHKHKGLKTKKILLKPPQVKAATQVDFPPSNKRGASNTSTNSSKRKYDPAVPDKKRAKINTNTTNQVQVQAAHTTHIINEDKDLVQIREAANLVIEEVTQEIRHCASMFQSAESKRPRVIIHGDHHASTNTKELEGRTTSPQPQLYDDVAVISVVKKFVLEVYCPFLLSAQKRMGNNSPNVYRIQLSTLLAIREMLITNQDKLFTFSSLKQLPSCSSERKYLSFVLANAIVKNASKRLSSNGLDQDSYSDFLQATRKYDSKSEEFHFSLTREDVFSRHTYHDGTRVGHQESLLAKVGFNYAHARHPLLHNKRRNSNGELVENEGAGSDFPKPTACAAFHVEVASKSDEIGENNTTLEALKSALRQKRDSGQVRKK